MIRHFAGGAQVLVQQRGRHGQRFARIVETRRIGRIHRKLAGHLHVLAGEIADRVVVLGAAQPARRDHSGIARRLLDLLRAQGLDPLDYVLPRRLGRRWNRLGRHFLRRQPCHHQRPSRIVPRHQRHAGIGLEVKLRRGGRAAVASDAIFRHERPHGLCELPVQGRAGAQRARNRHENGKGPNAHRDAGPRVQDYGHSTTLQSFP